MAVEVSYLGSIFVNSVELSDHAKNVSLTISQETRDVTAHGSSARFFRAGLSTYTVEATFFLDHASGSVESTLRPLVTIASTGFPLIVQKKTGSATNPTSINNPKYTLTAIIDGDVNLLSEEIGEVGNITVKFVPYVGTLTVSTSATS